LQQINDEGYATPYLADGRQLVFGAVAESLAEPREKTECYNYCHGGKI
jgi:hypothetical protein